MLKKENRISKKKDFDRAFKAGQSFYGKIIGLKVVVNDLKYSRFGIIISAKVSKKAVERNRIRRIIREEIKELIQKINSGKDFVFIIKSEAKKLNSKEIRLIINNLLIKESLKQNKEPDNRKNEFFI
jgi:ribonuclease P protein component